MEKERNCGGNGQSCAQHLKSPNIRPTIWMKLGRGNIQGTQNARTKSIKGYEDTGVIHNACVHKEKVHRRCPPTMEY